MTADLPPLQLAVRDTCNLIGQLLTQPRHLYDDSDTFRLRCAIAYLRALELTEVEDRLSALEALNRSGRPNS